MIRWINFGGTALNVEFKPQGWTIKWTMKTKIGINVQSKTFELQEVLKRHNICFLIYLFVYLIVFYLFVYSFIDLFVYLCSSSLQTHTEV